MRFYGAMKRGIVIKELCVRFKLLDALPTLRIVILDGAKYSSSKYSDHSLSSSIQSRSSSNPITPVKEIPEESLRRNVTVKRPSGSGDKFQSVLSVIDERRLVLFGLVHNLIRRVERYILFETNVHDQLRIPYQINNYGASRNGLEPECIGNETDLLGKDLWEKHRKKHSAIYHMFDGNHSFDKICLAHELSQIQLDELIERDPDVFVIWK